MHRVSIRYAKKGESEGVFHPPTAEKCRKAALLQHFIDDHEQIKVVALFDEFDDDFLQVFHFFSPFLVLFMFRSTLWTAFTNDLSEEMRIFTMSAIILCMRYPPCCSEYRTERSHGIVREKHDGIEYFVPKPSESAQEDGR